MTEHKGLARWVEDMKTLCQPKDIVWCNGSESEFQQLCASMVHRGTLTRLNESRRPNSFLARSHPLDVARMEDRTFIFSATTHEVAIFHRSEEHKSKLQSLRHLVCRPLFAKKTT